MSTILPPDQLEDLLPLLPHLAEFVRGNISYDPGDLTILLVGIGLETQPWALQEITTWLRILSHVKDPINVKGGASESAQRSLMLRGIPEIQAILAIRAVTGPTTTSQLRLNVKQLDFGELKPGQTACSYVEVQGGPGQVVLESDRLQVRPEQFPAGVTRIQVTVLPVEGGMLYSELRFVGSGGETRLPVLAQWPVAEEAEQTVVYGAMPPPIPEREPDDLPKEIVDWRGVRMNLIPAGNFWMGSNDSYSSKPVHQVSLDAFYIDIFPVTNRSYAKFLNEAGNQMEFGVARYSPEIGKLFLERGIWKIKSGYDEHPVVGVSWYGAVAYCSWRGGRLPTEAEWEKAARGGLELKKYPWGDEDPVCTRGARNGAQYKECKPKGTAPVGSFAPNGYGLFDMAGNVWEWVWDWFDENYYSTQSDWYNPQGPTAGTHKVGRGGCFYVNNNPLRVAARGLICPPSVIINSVGFRCASQLAP